MSEGGSNPGSGRNLSFGTLQDAARGAELFALTRVIRAVLEALLLLQLGFTHDEVEALLQRNYGYVRELNTALRMLNEENGGNEEATTSA